MDYISAAEAAKMWGISKRRVQMLCAEGRIPGVKNIANLYIIPRDAAKPKDPRKSKKNHEKSEDR